MDSGHAMRYEYLIRRRHQVGRYVNKCADADLFRSLEHLAVTQKDYSQKLMERSACVQKALAHIQQKKASVLSAGEQAVFTQYINDLDTPTLDKLCWVMEEAEKILAAHKIFPG